MRDQRTLFDLTQDGLVIGNKLQRVHTLEQWGQDGLAETEKILRRALKYQVKIGDKRAFKLLGLGWHRFELEVNGDVLGGFDFEVSAPKDRRG